MLQPFLYDLPADRIAQRPVYPYDTAKLLVVDNAKHALNETSFKDLASYLKAGDMLVFNDTSVIPARIFAEFEDTGGQVEILLVNQTKETEWQCLVKPKKKFTPQRKLKLQDGSIATVKDHQDLVLIDFNCSKEKLYEIGNMPIPPYIRKGLSDEQDKTDYQTCFAEKEGSIAAPTASLHFTPELIQDLEKQNIIIEKLTLHVGTASFLPLWQDKVENLTPPAEESFFISDEVKQKIFNHQKNEGRVIAVGTTVVRALESMSRNFQDNTDLFIHPGFDFQIVDALITNFHQPATTHLLLVEAWLGKEMLEQSYQYALNHNFRFLSYGDGMLCL